MSVMVGLKGQGKVGLIPFGGTIATGGTAQLVVPASQSRSYLRFDNSSDTAMYLGLGGPTATATLTNGVVTSISVGNAGFGYTYPPIVTLLGGAEIPGGSPVGATGLGSPYDGNPPTDVAQAVAVITTGAISSFAVTHGGAGYIRAPFVLIENDPRDPYGAFLPAANVGIPVAAGGSFVMENSYIATLPLSVFCASSSKAFQCFVSPPSV